MSAALARSRYPHIAGGGKFGVYRMFDAAGQLLYVGASSRPFERLTEHSSKSWWTEVEHALATVSWFDTVAAAAQEEASAIASEMPKHNVAGTSKRMTLYQGPPSRRPIPLSDENVQVLADLAGEVHRLDALRVAAIEERDEAIRAALSTTGVAELVRVTGLTRARIYQISVAGSV